MRGRPPHLIPAGCPCCRAQPWNPAQSCPAPALSTNSTQLYCPRQAGPVRKYESRGCLLPSSVEVVGLRFPHYLVYLVCTACQPRVCRHAGTQQTLERPRQIDSRGRRKDTARTEACTWKPTRGSRYSTHSTGLGRRESTRVQRYSEPMTDGVGRWTGGPGRPSLASSLTDEKKREEPRAGRPAGRAFFETRPPNHGPSFQRPRAGTRPGTRPGVPRWCLASLQTAGAGCSRLHAVYN